MTETVSVLTEEQKKALKDFQTNKKPRVPGGVISPKSVENMREDSIKRSR